MDRRAALAAVWLVAAGWPVAATAQETRAAEIAEAQAEKATRLAPRQPGKAERAVLWVERELVVAPNGFYPLFGSIYNGGGFAAGVGYRHYVADTTHVDAKGLYSVRGYTLAELGADSTGHGGGRVDLRARVGRRDATQVAFYGLGLDSPEARTNFSLTETYGGAEVQLRPVRWLIVGAGLGYEGYTVGSGAGRQPSTDTAFTPETLPGLAGDPAFAHLSASAGIDWRPARGYARRGGLYQARYHQYVDRDDTYSFSRLDGEIVQHLPILRETWVVSLRGLGQTTLDDDDQVPFFLMPMLGSGDTLRAYAPWRYRDRHAMLMSAEFRWMPNRNALDMAVFYDGGAVAATRRDLALHRLKHDVGIGLRFHGPATTPLRIELTRGSEGMRLVFAGGAAF
ncbi:MAG: BamA/TamA family outer membrane protein [Vicinamibacterales bacterium]